MGRLGSAGPYLPLTRGSCSSLAGSAHCHLLQLCHVHSVLCGPHGVGDPEGEFPTPRPLGSRGATYPWGSCSPRRPCTQSPNPPSLPSSESLNPPRILLPGSIPSQNPAPGVYTSHSESTVCRVSCHDTKGRWHQIQCGLCVREVGRTEAALRRNIRERNHLYQKDLERLEQWATWARLSWCACQILCLCS